MTTSNKQDTPGAGPSPAPQTDTTDNPAPPGYVKGTDVPADQKTVGIEAPVPSPRPEDNAPPYPTQPHYDDQGRAIQPGDTGFAGTSMEDRYPGEGTAASEGDERTETVPTPPQFTNTKPVEDFLPELPVQDNPTNTPDEVKK